MYLFNLLYCDGDDKAKLSLLYDLVVGPEQAAKKILKPNDEQLVRRLEFLVMIPTLLMTNIIEQQNKMASKMGEDRTILDEMERVQLLLIDSTNS